MVGSRVLGWYSVRICLVLSVYPLQICLGALIISIASKLIKNKLCFDTLVSHDISHNTGPRTFAFDYMPTERVPAFTLPEILKAYPQIEGVKIDIEGHETPVLNAFFSESPRSQWPRMILIETRHDAGPDTGAAGLCLTQGYGRAQQMRQNAVFVLPDGDK